MKRRMRERRTSCRPSCRRCWRHCWRQGRGYRCRIGERRRRGLLLRAKRLRWPLNPHADVLEQTSVHVSTEPLVVVTAAQPVVLAIFVGRSDPLANQALLADLQQCRRGDWQRSFVVNETRHPPSSSYCWPPVRDPAARALIDCVCPWVGSRPGCTVCQHPRSAVCFPLELRCPSWFRGSASTVDWLSVRAMAAHWPAVGAAN